MASPVTIRPLEEILNAVQFREDTLEVVFTDQHQVWCQGADGPSGHPKVYYTIAEKGYAECLYCDRLFVYDPSRNGTILEA